MLLVTNGDSAAECIEGAGLAGEVLPWRDVLHEGPVPAGLSDAELGEIRARFLADRGWASVRETAEGFARRDAALEGFGGHEEVVLLFEHDLYDQLQLVQVLDRLLRWDLGDTRLSLAVADEYLGNLGPEGLRALFLGRHGATGEELELANRAWEAFRSPDPTRLSALLDEDTSAASLLEVEPHRGRTIPSPSTLPVSTRLGRVRINDAPRSDSTKYEVLREGLGASYRLRSSC